jgi:hypothetical protein
VIGTLVLLLIAINQIDTVRTTDVDTNNRRVAAVGKKIVSLQTSIGVIYYIRIEESADFGVVITALEIVQPGLCGVDLAASP